LLHLSAVIQINNTATEQHIIMSHTIKGLSESSVQYDGSPLRVAIIHARWNAKVIDALVVGAVAKLKERGVKESNIIIESVPGSFELPLACSRSISRDARTCF
jgi:6,7-dimethyl-8-ribityllumazine synthase